MSLALGSLDDCPIARRPGSGLQGVVDTILGGARDGAIILLLLLPGPTHFDLLHPSPTATLGMCGDVEEESVPLGLPAGPSFRQWEIGLYLAPY